MKPLNIKGEIIELVHKFTYLVDVVDAQSGYHIQASVEGQPSYSNLSRCGADKTESEISMRK